jgi:hypothetical protein
MRFGFGSTAASSADSRSVSSLARLPNMRSLAASAPNTPGPNSATFR